MSDFLQKFKMYWKDTPDYWKLTDPGKRSEYAIGYYPLSFRDRLSQQHYIDFDETGLPMFPSQAGVLVHFCTGMCSFAFAHWEEFLNTGDKAHADHVIKVADYLIGMAEEVSDDVLVVKDYDTDERIGGITCAMNQGESISVLCRAWCLTKDARYTSAALKMARAFNFPYGKNGVTGTLPNGSVWYLEGGKMILNGHNYSLFGLNDLWIISHEQWVKQLLDTGITSVADSVALFDNGFWSWYSLNKPLYIASAMYHNLHICQLKVLSSLSGEQKLNEYAQKFAGYAASATKRARAGAYMLKAKISKKLS